MGATKALSASSSQQQPQQRDKQPQRALKSSSELYLPVVAKEVFQTLRQLFEVNCSSPASRLHSRTHIHTALRNVDIHICVAHKLFTTPFISLTSISLHFPAFLSYRLSVRLSFSITEEATTVVSTTVRQYARAEEVTLL